MSLKTPDILAIEWIKKHHPKLYREMRTYRPDLIREAYARPVNGLGEVGGLFDDILGFATKAIPLYQQQKVFSVQLKQASKGAAPAPAPVQYSFPPPAKYSEPNEYRQIPDQYGLKIKGDLPKKKKISPWIIGGGIAAVGALILFMRRKKRG